MKAGIVLNPSTPVSRLLPYVRYADFVLVMSVVPGFGGQRFQKKVLKKISVLNRKNLEIEIDGGINPQTARMASRAGVNIFVCGAYLYKGDIKARLRRIRKAIS